MKTKHFLSALSIFLISTHLLSGAAFASSFTIQGIPNDPVLSTISYDICFDTDGDDTCDDDGKN